MLRKAFEVIGCRHEYTVTRAGCRCCRCGLSYKVRYGLEQLATYAGLVLLQAATIYLILWAYGSF